MSGKDENPKAGGTGGSGKRRYLSAEKKYEIFLATERGEAAVGEILRREGLFASDLQRIRAQVKDGALDRLKAKPGPRPKAPSREEYEALRQELEQKERVLADLTVKLEILGKKTTGGSWER